MLELDTTRLGVNIKIEKVGIMQNNVFQATVSVLKMFALMQCIQIPLRLLQMCNYRDSRWVCSAYSMLCTVLVLLYFCQL